MSFCDTLSLIIVSYVSNFLFMFVILSLCLINNPSHKCLYSLNVDTVIKKGGIVGEVGMTGASTGPHLHIETRIYGIPIDYRKLESLPELFVIDVDKTKWIDK